VILEEMVMADCLKGLFTINSFFGVLKKGGGFYLDFGPDEINKEKISNIQTFSDEFSAAIVREQILDHLKLTTDNNVSFYTDTNFTGDEWKMLKAVKDKIVEFGKAYKV
jgi:hypothetical protein